VTQTMKPTRHSNASLACFLFIGGFLVLSSRPVLARKGYATRYWDCCKPHCAWSGNVPSGVTPEGTCDRQDKKIFPADPNRVSACTRSNDPDAAYTCHGNRPWAVSDTLSYGFAAAPAVGNVCGLCYKLRFTGEGKYGTKQGTRALKGKEMIVQATNIGYDVAGSQFDIMIPGGGVGLFDACTSQWGVSDPSELGAQYGGFLSLCQQRHGYDDHDALKTCVASKCDDIFGNGKFPKLHSGCMWFVDWFEVADNPTFESEEVACPAELVALTGMSRGATATPSDPPATASPTSAVSARPTLREKTSSPTAATANPRPVTPSPTGGAADGACPSKGYSQCGGKNWDGATCCPTGWSCKRQNEWYSQCLKSSGGTPLATETPKPTSTITVGASTSSPTSDVKPPPCNPNQNEGLVCKSGLTGPFGKWNICGSGPKKFTERRYCPPGFALCESGKCKTDENECSGGVKISKEQCPVDDPDATEDEGQVDACKRLECGSALCTRRKCDAKPDCAITLVEGKVACRGRAEVAVEDMCAAHTRKKNKWTRNWCLQEKKSCRLNRGQRKWRCVSRGSN